MTEIKEDAMREALEALELAANRFDQAGRGIWADDVRSALADALESAAGCVASSHAMPGAYAKEVLAKIEKAQTALRSAPVSAPNREKTEVSKSILGLADWIERSPSIDDYITIQISIDQRNLVASLLRSNAATLLQNLVTAIESRNINKLAVPSWDNAGDKAIDDLTTALTEAHSFLENL